MSIELVNALRDAGIAITVAASLATVFVYIVRYLTSINKSQDDRWGDNIDIFRQQLEVQKTGFQSLDKLSIVIETGNTQIEKRFDDMSSQITAVGADVKKLLMMLGEEKADG